MKKKLIKCMLFVLVALCCLSGCGKKSAKQIYEYSIENDQVTLTGLTEYGRTLEALDIPEQIDGKYVTTLGKNFSSCNFIVKKIIIPESVSLIETDAFSNCSVIEDMTIKGNVAIKEDAMSGLTNLKEFNIEGSVIEINAYSFWGNYKLQDIQPLLNTEIIYTETFASCESLVNVVIPDCVKEIDEYAFRGCKKLSTITIPSSVEKIAVNAFAEHNDDFKIITTLGSYAEQWAIENGYAYEYLKNEG